MKEESWYWTIYHYVADSLMPKGVCVKDEQPRWGTTSTARVGMKHVTRRSSEFLFFFKIYLIIYLSWLHWIFVAACTLSLVAMCRGHCLVAVCGLLIATASHVAESTGSRLLGFSRYSLWALELGLSSYGHGLSSVTCGLFKSMSLHWQAESHPLDHQRSPDFISEYGQGTG